LRPLSPTYVFHRGVRILRVDYSECLTAQEKIDHMEVAMRIIAMAEPMSILMLTRWRPPVCREIHEPLRRYARHNAPYVKASAVVGLNEFQRMVLWPMVADRPDRVAAFEHETSALNWLASHGAAVDPTKRRP